MATVQLVRASVQGTVYYIHNDSGKVYSYSPEKGYYLYYGMLERCDDKLMMSKSDGCLAGCRVKYRPDLKEAIDRFTSLP
jgi:hypothetical protein